MGRRKTFNQIIDRDGVEVECIDSPDSDFVKIRVHDTYTGHKDRTMVFKDRCINTAINNMVVGCMVRRGFGSAKDSRFRLV